MRRAAIVGALIALVLLLLVLPTGRREREHDDAPAVPAAPAIPRSTAPASEDDQGFLYGRVTVNDGVAYEGRLRWGGTEEAFWGDYFNGFKRENPWASHVPPERLKERRPVKVLGMKVGDREHEIDLDRPFMARFGDIARIEARGRDLRVTLKSGTVFHLDGFSADDLADGVRVWDTSHGVVDFGERRIRTIELLPTARLDDAPDRLHGTVGTRQGDFTGFVQWNRRGCVTTDELGGHTADGELTLRFDTIRSIARDSHDEARVTLLDGREVAISGIGDGNRGLYVDDLRYGRVLVSWGAFERVDFDAARSGPAYDDFPPGHRLTGHVSTRTGRRLTGRLVYDLDESETTETLDAPSGGLHYNVPFGLIASIVPAAREERARIIFHHGEELQLERKGDLGDGNAGLLIFVDGGERPEYVPWTDVERIDFDRLPAMYPPLGGD